MRGLHISEWLCAKLYLQDPPPAVPNDCGREARRSRVLNWQVRGGDSRRVYLLSPPLGAARAAPSTGTVKGTSEPLTVPERAEDREWKALQEGRKFYLIPALLFFSVQLVPCGTRHLLRVWLARARLNPA